MFTVIRQSGQSSHQKQLFEELPQELHLELSVLLKEDLVFSVPLLWPLWPYSLCAPLHL